MLSNRRGTHRDARAAATQQRTQPPRILGRGALLVVVEIDKYKPSLAPPPANMACPIAQGVFWIVPHRRFRPAADETLS
jgi:hypothetical protein